MASNTRLSCSTALLPLSFTRPSVVRWSNSTTRMTRFATSARNIDSFSPWCTSEANSCSPIIFASWPLALKSPPVRDAKAPAPNCARSPTRPPPSPHPGPIRPPRHQPIEPQMLGAHAPEGRQPPAQDVIAAAEASGALDRRDIRRLLPHAQEARVPPRVAADRARVLVGERATSPAGAHALTHGADRVREARSRFRRLLQQGKREPLCGLPSDPGELRKLQHEIIDSRHGARYSGS